MFLSDRCITNKNIVAWVLLDMIVLYQGLPPLLPAAFLEKKNI